MRKQPTKDPQIVALINTVRNYPSLYDYRLAKYHDVTYNEQAWNQIARQCSMESGIEAKTYWKKLHHSFTVFYRNELIRLVSANYDESIIGPLPKELSHTAAEDERFGNRTWGYYSDMRFIAPFRIKGTDPELERLIELAKPIVLQSNEHKSKILIRSKIVENENNTEGMVETEASASSLIIQQEHPQSQDTAPSSPYFDDIPQVNNNAEQQSVDDACLNSFFNAMFSATRVLPAYLQRRVKRELLQTLHNAEAEAERLQQQK